MRTTREALRSRPLSSRSIWIGTGVVVLVLGGAMAIVRSRAGAAAVPEAPGPPPPAPVATVTLDADRLVVERRYHGEVHAASDASLTVGEAGRVRRVLVHEGDRVQSGQLLLELDDHLARAELGEARASKRGVSIEQEHAERRAKQFDRLSEQSVVSEMEREEQAKLAASLGARSAAATASLRARSQRVQRHRIVAPFDGVVAQRTVDRGDWLEPGKTAIQLVTSGRAEVLVRVPGALLDALPTLDRIRVVKHDHEVAGALDGVVDALDRTTRTALLRVTPETRPPWLRPGDSVDVVFHVAASGGLVVPRDALVHGVADVRVFRVKDGAADPVAVRVLAEAGNRALVASDALVRGDSIVVRGNERLRPGQRVSPAPHPAAAPSR